MTRSSESKTRHNSCIRKVLIPNYSKGPAASVVANWLRNRLRIVNDWKETDRSIIIHKAKIFRMMISGTPLNCNRTQSLTVPVCTRFPLSRWVGSTRATCTNKNTGIPKAIAVRKETTVQLLIISRKRINLRYWQIWWNTKNHSTKPLSCPNGQKNCSPS